MTPSENFSGTAKDNLKAIRILCFALIIGVFLFTLISLLINKFTGSFIKQSKQNLNIFLWVLAIVTLICILAALRSYPKNITKSKNADTLNDKLNQYRSSLVIYMALCEGPALFSGAVFLLTGNFNSFAFTVLMLAMMLAKFPTYDRVNRDMELDAQEQLELE